MVYTVLLRSNEGIGENDDRGDTTFKVNWEQLLPKTGKEFLMKVLFRSPSSASNTEDYISIAIDGLIPVNWDSMTNGHSSIVAMPASYNGAEVGQQVYQEAPTDIGIRILRPSQQQIRVRILEMDGVTKHIPGYWVMILMLSEL